MTKETLEALRASIAKWWGICNGVREDMGSADCPLCDLFSHPGSRCLRCPVMKESGFLYCKGTPYDGWISYWRDGRSVWWSEDKRRARGQKTLLLALEEYQYLVSLLPKGELP